MEALCFKSRISLELESFLEEEKIEGFFTNAVNSASHFVMQLTAHYESHW